MSKCVNFHRTSNVAVSGENLLLTLADNPNGIVSLQRVCFVICQNIPTAGETLPVQVTINGANIPVYNKYSLPVTGSDLRTRRKYRGYYVVNGADSYLIVENLPMNVCGCGGCC